MREGSLRSMNPGSWGPGCVIGVTQNGPTIILDRGRSKWAPMHSKPRSSIGVIQQRLPEGSNTSLLHPEAAGSSRTRGHAGARGGTRGHAGARGSTRKHAKARESTRRHQGQVRRHFPAAPPAVRPQSRPQKDGRGTAAAEPPCVATFCLFYHHKNPLAKRY